MNKRKILSLAMALSIIAIMAVGATLAYFTDTDKASNVFTVGNIDIDLTETVGVKDGAGAEVSGAVVETVDGATYSNIMPGYKMKKEAVVSNVGNNDAYVRVTVKMNNYNLVNKAIDDVYGDDAAQGWYKEVFTGWDMLHSKETNVYPRRTINRTELGMDSTDYGLLAVDTYHEMSDYGTVDSRNAYTTGDRPINAGNNSSIYRDGFYGGIVDAYETVYTYYLKLGTSDSNKSYKLFDGLVCPVEFNNNQAKMFNELTIDIDVAAIQASGFTTPRAAFDQLLVDVPLV